MNVSGLCWLWHWLMLGHKSDMDVTQLCKCLPCLNSCDYRIYVVLLGNIPSTYPWIDLQAFPLVGYSACGWIILDAWHDHIFLFLLLQDVDSHILLQQPLIYCHFADGREDPCYMPVKDWKVLKTILTETLDNYNELNAAMHLVLFEDAMQHVWVD